MITPLHVRSAYSLLSGTALPQRLAALAAAQGHARLAMTDVNALYGATIFYKEALAAGVRPIIGAELSQAGLSAVALVQSDQGYENLCRLITRRHCGPEDSADLSGPDVPPDGDGCHAEASRCLRRAGMPRLPKPAGL